MFSKILIANRGEIACRIIRTAKRMGLATVAVYCDADHEALHVAMADEAVNIGPPPAATSYLMVDRIIAAAHRTGADAVHPGYGFLAERAAFPLALDSAGITFIGPNAGAISVLGDKIESKKLAAAAGVSTVPGHPGAIASDAEAIAAARDIGLPVMIKASAGGGGKGMRIARSEGEVAEGVRAARSEARSSFGDDRIFIERFIEKPRHVEIQVLGDRHGNIIHLGERECSIQRRNQKIIEEAPSTAVDADLRAAMGAQAVALAKAVHYNSAGTVEFILGADRHFYFLEMNTRLQVEHPVTECITGLDIVEQMIRVAAGERLSITQDAVRFDGWAVETRLYAEDPGRNFIPSIGQISRYQPPHEGRRADGTAVRVDDGVREDITIPVYFDPLIAKLITHGPDRASAIEAMADALDCFVVDGVANNLSFLSAIMENPRWQKGDLATSFVEEEYPQGFHAAKLDPATLARMAMVALSIDLTRRHKFRSFKGRLNGEGSSWRSDWSVAIGGTHFALHVEPTSEPDTLRMVHDGGEPVLVASAWRPGEVLWSGEIGAHTVNVQVRTAHGGVHLSSRGIAATARVMRPRVAELDRLMPEKKKKHSANQLRCPMPGLVVAIDAAEGQEVRAGDVLAVVEAMKMENVLRAERDGTVKRIVVKPGDTLAFDAVIMEFT